MTVTSNQTLPPPEGPEYTPCACSHIEPEHQSDAGACLVCGCGAYRPVPGVVPSDEDVLVAIEEALEKQLLPTPGFAVLEHTRDAVVGALVPLVARLRAASVVVPAADRAAVLREVAAECDKAGGAYGQRGAINAAGAAFALMETFLRKADEAEYVAAPCSVGGCEPGGEPCSTHERLMAHAEGDHELCAPDCGAVVDRVAAETPPAETLAAAVASCPGYETSPNPCRCPCYGCKHHCAAHNPGPGPAVVAQPGKDTETPQPKEA